MQGEEKEKLHRLEDIKSKLFSKSYEQLQANRSGVLHRMQYDVPDAWKQEGDAEDLQKKFFMKTSLFKKFFMFSIAFFVFALCVAGFMFLRGGNTVSNDNIDIAILGNAFTAGGEDLPLQIEITNRNSAALELADLVVEYPKGSASDLSQDSEHLRDSLGTIPAGQVRTDNMKIVLFGEQGSIRPIKISLEYRVEGSNAIFVKDKDYSVSISSAPIDLAVTAPDTLSPNQNITLIVKATLNATKAATGLILKADYPPGFQFQSANPTPVVGNTIWDLGDLSPGAQRDIVINGSIIGADDGEQKTFHFFAGSKNDTDKSNVGVVFNSLGHTVTITKPFIQARLLVNGIYQNEYAADSKTTIQGQIQWANNLNTKLNDVVITARLSGSALDKQKITTQNGFYDSVSNTITWDKNSQTSFAEVNPGDSGTVDFAVAPLSLYSPSGLLVDPAITVNISISGKQPLEGNATQSLSDSESKTVKIISDLGVVTKSTYSTGPFTNTGGVPPKAGNETTYTVTWVLSNTANTILNAHMTATLPPLVRFIGPVSPSAEDLRYNPSTQQIDWNIGSIQKGMGITGGDKEVSFQVGVTPSTSQIGTVPIIVNDAILTGHDDFANVDVRVNKTAMTTRLTNDPAFPAGADRVTQ